MHPKRLRALATGAALALLAGCAGGDDPTVEATSLLGEPLRRREFAADVGARLEAQLDTARRAHASAPADADSIIWLGRRLAYLERYREAVDVFTDGIERHPGDARLYRHRGHRYITLRRFDDAIRDLERAAELTAGVPDEVEPDGAPNRLGIPTSTTQGNVHYHLALAHYLEGDYERSLASWQDALRLSRNDDTRVAVTDWMYMTLRRLDRHDEARELLEPITAEMEIIENSAYHRRLLFYKGEFPADSLLAPGGDELQYVTQGYGVANWYRAEGADSRAREILDRVLRSGYWAAFGYVAAEADVAREGR